MINGPSNYPIKRMSPIDKDRSDHQDDSKKRKKVIYNGRRWGPAEDELLIQPTKTQSDSSSKKGPGIYADRYLFEKAEEYFLKLTTLEEKVAQLFFLEAEAIYDVHLQNILEILVMTEQIGGILFKKGEYKRQKHVIERFKDLSKLPLLFANDFHHGLSFYLQGAPFKTEMSNQMFMDLGKAVMVQNRHMGVHIQLDYTEGLEWHMEPLQAKAFRKGIREAQGIVGKKKLDKKRQFSHPVFPNLSLKENLPLTSAFTENSIQEFAGYRVLMLYSNESNPTMEQFLNAFKDHYDIFLCDKNRIADGIRSLCCLVRSGKVREEDLDKKVMKVLMVKAIICR